jgi:N-acetylneuraminic acid mutarotase
MRISRRRFLGLALTLPVLAACSEGDDGDQPAATSAPALAGEASGTWIPQAPLPTPRSEVASALLDGKIYVIAGFDSSGRSTAIVEAYDSAAGRWEQRARLPASRDHAMAVSQAGKLYVFGGSLGQATRDAFVYDPVANSWSALPPMPLRRTAGGAAVLADVILVVGGTGDDPPTTMVFDPATARWSLGPVLPDPREHLAVTGTGSTVYVIGGRWENQLKGTNEALSSLRGPWLRLPDLPTPRGGTAGAVLDGRIYVAGGEAFDPTRTFKEVEVFDPQAGVWRRAPDLPTPRHGLAVQAAAGRLYVIGGGPTAGLSVSAQNEALEPG